LRLQITGHRLQTHPSVICRLLPLHSVISAHSVVVVPAMPG